MDAHKDEGKDYKARVLICFGIMLFFFFTNTSMDGGSFLSFLFPIVVFGIFWSKGFRRAEKRIMEDEERKRLPEGNDRPRFFDGKPRKRKSKSYTTLYDERELI